MKINNMSVELLNSMGSDLTIVRAARVSFDKTSEWETLHESTGPEGPGIDTKILSSGDEKLIKYLAKHNHWSPFGHATAQFRIKAPIFVARQLVKHQIGLCWNEVSRRYVDDEPEFWFPKEWRGKPKNAKQGSSDKIIKNFKLGEWLVDDSIPITDVAEDAVRECVELYNSMIDIDISPEQARMVLPQNMMTSWYWTGSLYAFARVCNQRMKFNSQEETREVVKGIDNHMKTLYPVSWKYLIEDVIS